MVCGRDLLKAETGVSGLAKFGNRTIAILTKEWLEGTGTGGLAGAAAEFFGGVKACDALDGEDCQTLIWKQIQHHRVVGDWSKISGAVFLSQRKSLLDLSNKHPGRRCYESHNESLSVVSLGLLPFLGCCGRMGYLGPRDFYCSLSIRNIRTL